MSSFMETGCLCPGCLKSRQDDLLYAKTLWNMGCRKISFVEPKDFDDLNYPFIINGFEVNVAGLECQMHQVLADLFEFLEIDNVEMEFI